MIGGMAIAVEPAPAGGELTAARALGRLRRAAPGAVNTAMAAVALVGAGIVVAFNGGTDASPTSSWRWSGSAWPFPRARRSGRSSSRAARGTGSGSRC